MTDKSLRPARKPDHGGNLDAACQQFGGTRADWIDLSTGINPVPYPIATLSADLWTALPDQRTETHFIDAARDFWSVPDHLDILPTHGASAAIAALPSLLNGNSAAIPAPTYNEHAHAFQASGWTDIQTQIPAETSCDATVLVHPNNPDGKLWSQTDLTCAQTILDESFADCLPGSSLLPYLDAPGHIVLKSFGKFWGLAGLRLGAVIGTPEMLAKLRLRLGPWAVSGPALDIGARALRDVDWARQTRRRLAEDAQRLDALAARRGWKTVGGTPLFRLYACAEGAAAAQEHLAEHKIWSRVFPYSDKWLRLGLPSPESWARIEEALRP